MYKKIIFVILIIIFFGHLLFRINSYRDRYQTPFDAKYWENRYQESQWVNPVSKAPIGDDGLYTYVSYEYIKGKNPTLLNPEMPFMGKYLLGLSILAINNENIFALLTGIFVLITLYLFNLNIFKNKFYAFLPVLLFSLEPLFYQQLRAPFFDLLQLEFLLLFLLTFIKKKYWLSSVFLGCFAATKFPFMVVLPVAAGFISLFVNNRQYLKKYLFTLPVIFVVYLATYLQFFLLGNSFIDFLKVQKFIFMFYLTGAKAPFFGTVIPLLFSGTWFTHFQTVEKVPEWRILWPIIFIMSAIAYRYLSKINIGVNVMFLWVIVYLLFLSFTPPFPRYLLLLLPFLYNLSIWVLLKRIPLR